MSLTTTIKQKGRPAMSVFRIEPETSPAPCVLCNRRPEPGEPVLETNFGEPRVLCVKCVVTASTGIEDLHRIEAGFRGNPPW